MASLGNLIAKRGAGDMKLAPWLVIFPSVVMVVHDELQSSSATALRDALDPKDRDLRTRKAGEAKGAQDPGASRGVDNGCERQALVDEALRISPACRLRIEVHIVVSTWSQGAAVVCQSVIQPLAKPTAGRNDHTGDVSRSHSGFRTFEPKH